MFSVIKEKPHLEETHNIPHVVFETQIDHTVSFVHAEILAIVESEPFFLQHVNETPGSRDYDMQSLGHNMALLIHRDTSDAQQCVQLRILAFLRDGRTPSDNILVRLVG